MKKAPEMSLSDMGAEDLRCSSDDGRTENHIRWIREMKEWQAKMEAASDKSVEAVAALGRDLGTRSSAPCSTASPTAALTTSTAAGPALTRTTDGTAETASVLRACCSSKWTAFWGERRA